MGRSRCSHNEVQHHHHTEEIVPVEEARHTVEIVLEEVVYHKPLAGSKEGNQGRLLPSPAAAAAAADADEGQQHSPCWGCKSDHNTEAGIDHGDSLRGPPNHLGLFEDGSTDGDPFVDIQ